MRRLLGQRLAALLCILAVWSGLCAVVLHMDHQEVCCQTGEPVEQHHDAATCSICQFIVQANTLPCPAPALIYIPRIEPAYAAPAVRKWASEFPIYFSPRGPPLLA